MSFVLYLLKSALILTAFYAVFRLLALRNETFHRLNRFLILSMLVLSFILPSCHIRIHRQTSEYASAPLRSGQTVAPLSCIDDFLGAESNTIDPSTQITNDLSKPQAQEVLLPASADTAILESDDLSGSLLQRYGWRLFILAVWFIGALYCFLRTMLAISQIRSIVRNSREVAVQDGIRILTTSLNLPACSWLNSIILSEQDYMDPNAPVIIEHEMAHVSCRHSMDLMFVDFLSALQWFNPTVFFLRADLREVHEYQADTRVLSDGIEKQSYQLLLFSRIASVSGYSVYNTFKDKRFLNRIFMMNRHDSGGCRVCKALFVPVLTVLFLLVLSVTVYDCSPMDRLRNLKADNTIFGDSLQILDARYGQGKFFLDLGPSATVRILPDMDSASVELDSADVVLSIDEIPQYLTERVSSKPVLRCTIILDGARIADVSRNGLDTIRPFTDRLAERGIRPIVVRTEEQAVQTGLSTYKYARIYPLAPDRYALDHNSLLSTGNLYDMARWINTLDIQYVSFYPDTYMPWSHARALMDIAMARGVRTFFVCRLEGSTMEQNGTRSLRTRMHGRYSMTILPTASNVTEQFDGMTLAQVYEQLTSWVRKDFTRNAFRVVEHPVTDGNPTGLKIEKVAFCSDALYMSVKAENLTRNSWVRPMSSDFFCIRAGDRLYRLVDHVGFPDFSSFPVSTTFTYACGSLVWLPEHGTQYSLLRFEPVSYPLPDSIRSLELALADSSEIRILSSIGICPTAAASDSLDGTVSGAVLQSGAIQFYDPEYYPFVLPNQYGTPVESTDIMADPHNKYVLLNFWSTTDRECGEIMHTLQDNYARYHDSGLEIISVSLDSDSNAWLAAIDSLASSGPTWTQLHESRHEMSSDAVSDLYHINITPYNLLINTVNGKVMAILTSNEILAKVLPQYFTDEN